jgi:hypothetical protein
MGGRVIALLVYHNEDSGSKSLFLRFLQWNLHGKMSESMHFGLDFLRHACPFPH